MSAKQAYYELSDSDEVERMRQVRREQEERFASVTEYFDWLAGLQRQHDRSTRSKASRTDKTEKPSNSMTGRKA